nr:response regulator [Streptococcus constellatus]
MSLVNSRSALVYSIMIVEDEYLVRQGISSLVDFKKFNMQVIGEAENGLEAWEKIQAECPDIILTDINMPQMNGIKLAQLAREQYPQLHIIFLTGYDDFDYALSAVKLGADDYLLKPFSREDVEAMLIKVKEKLDKEKKQQQVHELVEKAEFSDLEQAIHDRLADTELSLKSLSFQLGFNSSYLSVLIKKELGLPFQDYLIQERMKRAKLLLLTTDLKVYEIAEQVGFEDMNYFSQRFKQIVGVTPRQFKKGDSK